MPTFRHLALAAFAVLLLGAAGPARTTQGGQPSGQATAVPLQSNPGTQADTIARRLAADDIAAARARGDEPLVLTGRAVLGGPQPALLVQLQSAQECGSSGCTTSVYAMERGRWQRVLDSATGKVTVATRKTRGRNDIVSEDDRFVWNGTAYVSVRPAPSINLRAAPRQP